MSAELVRELWHLVEARDWAAVGARLDPEVIIDWPHSGERIRGRANYVAIQAHYPEGWHVEVLRIVESPQVVASEVRIDHGDEQFFCCGFYEIRRRVIVRGTEYWTTARGEPPPDWRARWIELTPAP